MKPILSPWLFYFADVADALNALLVVLAVLAVVAIITLAVFFADSYYLCEDEDEDESNGAKKILKLIKVFSVVAIICILLAVVVPSKDTMYRMMISKYITTDTINEGTDKVKELIDYFVERTNEK